MSRLRFNSLRKNKQIKTVNKTLPLKSSASGLLFSYLQSFKSREPLEQLFRERSDPVASKFQIHQGGQVIQASLVQMVESVVTQIPSRSDTKANK